MILSGGKPIDEMTDEEIGENLYLKDKRYVFIKARFSSSWINLNGEHPKKYSVIHKNNLVVDIKDTIDGKWVFFDEKFREMARNLIVVNSWHNTVVLYD